MSDLHDRPSLGELLDAVREHLEVELTPHVPDDARYHLRVAVNLLRTAGREVELGAEQAAAHTERLQGLGFADDAALAAALRAGAVPADRLPAVRAAVSASVRDKLLVANPRYLAP